MYTSQDSRLCLEKREEEDTDDDDKNTRENKRREINDVLFQSFRAIINKVNTTTIPIQKKERN